MAIDPNSPKYIYADILIALAQADDDVDSRERRLLDDIFGEMDLDPDTIEEMWLTPRTMDVIEAQLADIGSATFKHCLLKDCYLLAYADDTFEPSEGRFIKRIADVMHVDPSIKSEIENWVSTSLAQKETADRLFGGSKG